MMRIKICEQKLLEIESFFDKCERRNWMFDVTDIQEFIHTNASCMSLYIRVIYILHHILVEESYSKNEGEIMATLLRKYFVDSYSRFEKEPEYLFFVGKILYIAEWYFGLNDDCKPMEDRLAFKMQKRAFEKDPTNLLYEWGYLFSKNEKEKALAIALKIISEGNVYLNWLKSKGFPGKYIIESINNMV